MGRFVIFALSVGLVAAYLTGHMRDIGLWFDVRPEQVLYLVALPFAALAALVLLRDKA